MAFFSFDLQDDQPPVGFNLPEKDADRFIAFMAECHQAVQLMRNHDAFDLVAHIQRQQLFSERTFGPGARSAGVIDHIRKELTEIEADPSDLEEWVDVIILAIDGAWRTGASPHKIARMISGKQTKNENRKWPDWRTVPTDRAIEHDRSGESPTL